MSRIRAQRPTLLPSLRRLWRGSNHLQLGADPGRAVMLELTDPASARVLDLLDGSRTEPAILRDAAQLAISEDDATAILHQLRHAGLVVDAHTLCPAGTRGLAQSTRRRLEHEAAALLLRRDRRGDAAGTPAARLGRRLSAQIVVAGCSQLAVPIASALAAACVGQLNTEVFRPADDLSPPAADVVRSVAPDVNLAPIARGRANFAVLVGLAAPAALTALSYRRTAHLAVTIRDATVVVGPLVRPGVSPCLNCLDLHRLDRDPAWRVIAPQLHGGGHVMDPLAFTTALAGAAFAAAEVLTHIDGGTPQTLGTTVEIAGPADTIRRSWSRHPACGCTRRRRTQETEPLTMRS